MHCICATHSFFPYTTLFRSAPRRRRRYPPARRGRGSRRREHSCRRHVQRQHQRLGQPHRGHVGERSERHPSATRSEEHTSELQSRGHLVCRLLLEKKKK